jgi:N-acetylglucosaminyldiphosphoundecaprenol N-acetyl-beta-D-mannosaminyltransferase
MAPASRLKVLEIWVDPVSREAALERVRRFLAEGGRAHTIFAANPEKNFSVPADPLLYRIYRNADLLLPDGIGMVLAARLLYGLKIARVPGAEFVFDICGLAAETGKGVFVYGAKEAVNAAACRRLAARFPGLKIAGRSNGYVAPAEMDGLVERIDASGAEILLVALGSPKQEQWCAAHAEKLARVKVIQGIGGTLDTIAGTVKRAPAAWCRLNLEWLYRLLKEPRRIQRQKVLPMFAWAVLMEKVRNP